MFRDYDRLTFRTQHLNGPFELIKQLDGQYACVYEGSEVDASHARYSTKKIQMYIKEGVWIVIEKEKQMKLKDIIKPFMRVKTRSEGTWIAVEKDGEVFLVNGNGYNHIFEAGEYGENLESYDIMEVYSAPYYTCDYLRFDKFGDSVWKLQPFKSAQQIAVDELEASIKASQEKLEELKKSLTNV